MATDLDVCVAFETQDLRVANWRGVWTVRNDMKARKTRQRSLVWAVTRVLSSQGHP